MTKKVSDNTNDAYEQFGKWLIKQPFWLQDATYRIYTGKTIDEKQIDRYADMCIDQHRQQDLQYEHLSVETIRAEKENKNISVLSLSEIKNVNALAEDTSLEFSESGVTVIYGLNGAGKSGYMRIFKELSGSPYEEAIQPNVYKKTKGSTPSCKVRIKNEGKEIEEAYDLSKGIQSSILSACDVFDTRISNAYITSSNKVSYQPFIFTVLSKLAIVADKISKRIDERESHVLDRTITIPDDIKNHKCMSWLKEINKDSKVPEDFIEWTEDDQKQLEEIPRLLDREKVKQQVEIIESRVKLITQVLRDLEEANRKQDAASLGKMVSAWSDTKEKYDLSQKLFSEKADIQDSVSVNVKAWKDLWKSAKDYYESFIFEDNKNHFGEKGSICPLCHQSIYGKTQERISSINKFINGSCLSDLEKTKKELISYRDSICKRQYSSGIVQQLLEDMDKKNLQSIVDTYKRIEEIKLLSDVTELSLKLSEVDLEKAITSLKSILSALEERKKPLVSALELEGKEELINSLQVLKCKKWCVDNLSTIQRVITNLKKIDDLQCSKQFTTTNKITKQSNVLADLLITQAFIDRFTKELNILAPHVKVKLSKGTSQKGNSPYKVSIDSDSGIKCKPEDILSEGEQRIVALAAFFADATGRDDSTPIIIDDPISSLDLNYEEAATRRIVKLASSRQVIVFTHRISLLVGIGEVCKANNVQMQEAHIRSANRGKGIPESEEIYHGKIKAQLNALKVKVVRTRNIDSDLPEYDDAVSRICQQFRIYVERSVEDVLLLGMVHRFHRRIMTNNKVMKISQIKDSDCQMIDDMMTKYSFTEHSQPMDSMPVQLNLDEIDNDIDSFISWVVEFTKRVG
ncbi:AAA family ATPase [Fannyhessea vaginae]|uniref:AAA family ATPase n=1 Tax=Fannyhessea vaginae TaxID=82135 RepID=UPI003A80C9F6